ncbi:helix-turn-helix domain-containing protein [Paraburkholderia xenovorans]
MLAIYEHGSVSAAARHIGLSQPMLTHAILKFEQRRPPRSLRTACRQHAHFACRRDGRRPWRA